MAKDVSKAFPLRPVGNLFDLGWTMEGLGENHYELIMFDLFFPQLSFLCAYDFYDQRDYRDQTSLRT